MEIELLDPLTCDLEELAQLQRDSFKEVKGTSAFDSIIEKLHTAEHFRRKYQLAPAGKARIVAIRENGNLLAMNAMVPETLIYEGGTASGWQSCDTATHPKARGRGLFKRCIETLRKPLVDGEVSFGYPNANATPGWVRSGWKTNSVLDIFVAPWPRFANPPAIQPIDRFDAAYDELARRTLRPGTVCIERSAAYLNWRYRSDPHSPYSVLEYRDNGKLEGFIVLRTLPLRPVQVCIVMEVFASNDRIKHELLCAASRWGQHHRAWPTLIFTNDWGENAWLRHGFIRVPRKLSPRELVLMGIGIGEAGQKVFEREWTCYAGDWDVF